MDNETAKRQLDKVINRARVHFYKPIQIAEILHRDRSEGDIDLYDLDSYRASSKKWRDEISLKFVGNISTSSSRFQDNLFEANATPPEVLAHLGIINKNRNGVVEAYIYNALKQRLSQMSAALSYVLKTDSKSFALRNFINNFTQNPGLARSIDKIYEMVVYALFSTLLEILKVNAGVRIDNINNTILNEFSDFTEKVLGLSKETPELYQAAKVYRVGVTNAADRGLDMWGNFGVAIQIKHVSLTRKIIEDINSSVSADRIIIVCKESEKDVLVSVLKQLGSANRIQSVISENELIKWYEKALRGQSAELVGNKILKKLANEIKIEFPSTTSDFTEFFKDRGYDRLTNINF
ncbi:HaeII family restriction endonuclease [Candidatus Poribacteria bacterium]|nr:HaeII family restriction endonuclease [Candidatus Poribacteria bacterium]